FASAWFTALNNGPVSAVISFTRTLIFELGCVFLLPLVLGIDGIWLAVNVAEVLALLLSAALVFGFRKRYGY
ncbi:MAG: MATE family efflux transporter, partial [Bacteroidales bacterium]|nr:MATE family efflux transporter [Bacteroidales bacterium]